MVIHSDSVPARPVHVESSLSSTNRMMEEPLNRGASPSGDSCLSGGGEINPATIVTALDDRLLDISTRHSLNVLRTTPAKKAKRVRFFRNGDKFYTGVVVAVTPERYRSFDSLVSDLTRALISSVTLPNGVRAIYTMDGRKVQSISDLEDGKCYVCSGQGEIFKKVEYSSSKVRRGSSLSGLPQSPAVTGRQTSAIPQCVKARIITLIRHGTKPRKVVRLLLNKRNAPSLEHALEAITDAVKLDSGAVRKVFAISGQQVTNLEHFFENEEVFLAYGPEKSTQEDFELDFEESKCVQSFRKGPWVSKRQSGPMPRMPRKSGKKALTEPQVRTPSPTSLILPQPLRLHYAVGHVIGDGNFAVVRRCVHKLTGVEYAMKIVDKFKCQGKETMLASEVAILRQVCHPNIISLISEQETTDQLFLVMELVKGGDLFDAIAAVTKFSEAEASVMISHLTSALAYLHSHHIVHRDVKPENLLVEMEGSRVRCLKLGDFGLAQVVKEPLYTVCGTPTYVAPEILAETGYGLKIDVWAVGVILYILLCGFPPFVSPKNEQEELFERILSGQYEFTSPYWDDISESAKQLITNMLQIQPELRFSAEDVLDHPWLASFLGGEPPAAATVTESAQQYGDQQRQPLRLATFEFDYKKQRRADVPGDEQTGSGVIRARWSDVSSSPTSQVNHVHQLNQLSQLHQLNQLNAKPCKLEYDYDEVDLAIESRDQEEPTSLSADCLQDIRALTKSVRDLMSDANEFKTSPVPARSTRSSRSAASSLSSIPERTSAYWKGSGTRLPSISYRGSNLDIQEYSDGSTSKLHSAAKRNGNSLSDIHSRSFATPSPPGSRMLCHVETPKSARSNFRRPVSGKRISNKGPGTTANGGSKVAAGTGKGKITANDLRKSLDEFWSSTDGISGSSDNEIEASDSFINTHPRHSSHGQASDQSMESSDSFENVRFFRIRNTQESRDFRDVNENSRNGDRPSNSNLRCKETKAEAGQTSNRLASGSRQSNLIARRTKPSLNVKPLLHTEDTPSPGRGQEASKSSQREPIKRREKKLAPASSQETKVEKKVPDWNGASRRCTRAMAKDVRKFSSTDELRDDKQVQVKPKRFSLYYTPQPLRKNYEAEGKVGKDVNRNPKENVRPGSAKTNDCNKRKEEPSAINDKKDLGRHRKSVAETSTAASRSRSTKQSVHVRSVERPTLAKAK
ncbi:serine/threonine-protein kinase par-1 isoform X2 [Orussus abietinus]|uniref:serine/threonine-protein kinase par-1 isoform X2 n=1 Tax=Orussus abietinus TaxID=222816 RepID=UPI000C715BD9|nr:serine/threonine-protein kinase par-1 isoform X2 [Orussus abietinus]